MEKITHFDSLGDTEKVWENELRPKTFDDFPGQDEIKNKLKIFIQAAKERSEALDHTLLS
ncbi:MAG: Holliday junction branch migration DNA helicase RuvB, partial [Pseudobdellovibrionaceae bacterium]